MFSQASLRSLVQNSALYRTVHSIEQCTRRKHSGSCDADLEVEHKGMLISVHELDHSN